MRPEAARGEPYDVRVDRDLNGGVARTTIDRDHLDNIRALGASRGWLIWDPRRQTWGDKIASTFVVKACPFAKNR